ncbi:MAG: hypothetical protein JKY93_03380 [Gammaproteobacteria bacterium]|nr:hypothetical protein [Gammaproteobacteria bacterium]
MKRIILSLFICSIAMPTQAGGLKRAFTFKAKVHRVKVEGQTFRIMEHKTEPDTIMVTTTAGKSLVKLNPDANYLRRGAIAFVKTKGKKCRVSAGKIVVKRQYEYTYTC